MKKRIAAIAGVVLVIGIFVTTITPSLTAQGSRTGFIDPTSGEIRSEPKAPMAASADGNNVYIVWWTNRTGNWEVMFRASNDGGATFGEAINLSNSTDAQSQNAEIVAAGESNVFVSWWETNQMNGTSESVLRVSTDAGETFGPMLRLGANGTISATEEGEEEGAAAAEGEGAGEEEAAAANGGG